MTRRLVLAAGLTLVTLTLACASTGERSGSNPNVITEAELAQVPTGTAFEVIQNLRPRWVRDRGPQSFGLGSQAGIMVYIDGARIGKLDALHGVQARHLASAQWLSAGEATRRFGMGHPDGAILLTTK